MNGKKEILDFGLWILDGTDNRKKGLPPRPFRGKLQYEKEKTDNRERKIQTGLTGLKKTEKIELKKKRTEILTAPLLLRRAGPPKRMAGRPSKKNGGQAG
ncbi:MAG: hypothetical protein PHE49_06290 [bacterium]|nr:hypothetical protein [bacterium]